MRSASSARATSPPRSPPPRGGGAGDRSATRTWSRSPCTSRAGPGSGRDGSSRAGLLDEAMVEVTAGATSPAIASWIYCSVIDACQELHELRRAREWTVALNAWCDAGPSTPASFSGRVPHPPGRAAAAGRRLAGRGARGAAGLRAADPGLRRGDGRAGLLPAGRGLPAARRPGRGRGGVPQGQPLRRPDPARPGAAVVGAGRVDAAVAAIRRALAETADRLARSRLLPAYVEIMLAAARRRRRARGRRRSWPRSPRSYDTAALHARSATPRRGPPRRGRAPGGAAGAAPGLAAVAGAGRAVRGRPRAGARRAGLPRAARRGHRGAGAGRGPAGLRPARGGPRPGPHRRCIASGRAGEPPG